MPQIDWTNPTIQGVLVGSSIALIGVIVAAVAGIAGATIGARIGAGAIRRSAEVSREQAEKDREDAAKARKEAREDARAARFSDQKRELYTELWIACDRHKRDVEAQLQWRRDMVRGTGGQDPGIGSTEPARRAYLAVTLLLASYEPAVAAGTLYSATVRLGEHHAYTRLEGQPMWGPDEQSWIADLNAWSAAAAAFENEATADLLR